jgi:hypothetical protein
MMRDCRQRKAPQIFAVHPGDKITQNISRDIRTEGDKVVDKIFAFGDGHGGVSIAQERSACPIEYNAAAAGR